MFVSSSLVTAMIVSALWTLASISTSLSRASPWSTTARIAKFARDELGALPGVLDHFERYLGGITGDPAGKVEADIAAAHDHDAAGDLLLVAEKGHDTVEVSVSVMT